MQAANSIFLIDDFDSYSTIKVSTRASYADSPFEISSVIIGRRRESSRNEEIHVFRGMGRMNHEPSQSHHLSYQDNHQDQDQSFIYPPP